MLAGSFLKTPTLDGAEILGGLGFDVLIVDEEHSPFDRQSTDAALFAARAMGAAGYGGRMWDCIAPADAGTTIGAQIEDPEALDEIDATAFVHASDQDPMKQAAAKALADLRNLGA